MTSGSKYNNSGNSTLQSIKTSPLTSPPGTTTPAGVVAGSTTAAMPVQVGQERQYATLQEMEIAKNQLSNNQGKGTVSAPSNNALGSKLTANGSSSMAGGMGMGLRGAVSPTPSQLSTGSGSGKRKMSFFTFLQHQCSYITVLNIALYNYSFRSKRIDKKSTPIQRHTTKAHRTDGG